MQKLMFNQICGVVDDKVGEEDEEEAMDEDDGNDQKRRAAERHDRLRREAKETRSTWVDATVVIDAISSHVEQPVRQSGPCASRYVALARLLKPLRGGRFDRQNPAFARAFFSPLTVDAVREFIHNKQLLGKWTVQIEHAETTGESDESTCGSKGVGQNRCVSTHCRLRS